MKYMKLALLALLIPSAILPMERVKNGLKKAAAAGTILSLGYLGYKAAQAYGFENLNKDVLTGWQTGKNWLHDTVYGSYEQKIAQLEQEKAHLTEVAAMQAEDLAARQMAFRESKAMGENQTKHHNAQLNMQHSTIEILETHLANLRANNEQLQRELSHKEAASMNALPAHPLENILPKEESRVLPVVEEQQEDLAVRSSLLSENRALNQYEEYRKALRADIVNMSTIFVTAKKAFVAIDSIMAGNRLFDVELKPRICAAELILGQFIAEIMQKDVNFEINTTVQKARKILAECQMEYDFILGNLNDLTINLENKIRSQYWAGQYRDTSSDQRLKDFNSFVDSFRSRKDQCRAHEKNYTK